MLRIITDSSADFTKEEAEALGIRIVPLTVVFDQNAYLEEEEISKDEFYRRLTGGEFPRTSQPSEEQFTQAFAETNGEETLAILLSSALSGTVNTAELAKRDGNFTKVHVYDSLCATAMLRILVETAYRNRDKSASEVIALLDELRPRLRLHAYLDTLEYLYKGGRVKKSIAVVGELLGIKPLIEILPNGSVGMAGKARGQKKAVKALADAYLSDRVDPGFPVYFLQTDSDDPPRAVMKATGLENARLFRIGCALGSHIGPNAAGIVYVVEE